MKLEVEQKFPVANLAEFESRLISWQATWGPVERQIDTYFAHPARDFAATDEALRIRQVNQKNVVTYKGPKIDSQTKTRRELEIALPPGEPAGHQFRQLLEALGFRPVAQVTKQRRTAQIAWEGWEVEVALDQVEGVGDYVELEIGVDDGPDQDAQQTSAQSAIVELAGLLGLSGSERRSYLELWLQQQSN